jgi:hypothetical protein
MHSTSENPKQKSLVINTVQVQEFISVQITSRTDQEQNEDLAKT